MTTIASQLEAALPANDDDNGPVTLPVQVVRGALDELFDLDGTIAWLEEKRDAAELQLTDQQNARWLAWLLAGIAIGATMVGYIGWVS